MKIIHDLDTQLDELIGLKTENIFLKDIASLFFIFFDDIIFIKKNNLK